MAYDAARGQVVLFGGATRHFEYLGDTWTWDGTDWTSQTPVHHPSPRFGAGMAYDAARGQVVLFGGFRIGGTWTWDGTDWTKRGPIHSPIARHWMGMAYDEARGQVVLFGGRASGGNYLADTWTWDGTDWTVRLAGSIGLLRRRSGPPGVTVDVYWWGFAPREMVKLSFLDSSRGRTLLGRVRTSPSGAFSTSVTIPLTATPGRQRIEARGLTSGQVARTRFKVR